MRAGSRLALALALCAGTASAQPDRAGFVRVEGGRFVLDGRRFRFTGANASAMHGRVHREALDALLDAAVEDGMRVVRVWALGERPASAPPWTRDFAFRVGPEGWVSESFEHLDGVIEGASRRGLRLIIVLANRWQDYGGIPQYLDWIGLDSLQRRALGEDASLARFFDDGQARALYLAHVARVVTRVNARTGLRYADDPTIMAWELANELPASPRISALLLQWTRESAAAIHAMDARHLVSAGSIGYTRRAERAVWTAVQALPEIDYADAHAYPTRLATVQDAARLDDFIDDHAVIARRVLHKPLVWGEFGFTTTEPTHLGAPSPTWYTRFLQRAARVDSDGALVWLYTTSRDPPADHGIFVDAVGESPSGALRAALRSSLNHWGATRSSDVDALLGDGVAPRWRTDREAAGPGTTPARPTQRGRRLSWQLAPERYASIRAEAFGRWDGFSVMHIWASGLATITYSLQTPAGVRGGRRVLLRARVSSELPGRGESSSALDVSRVRVSVDGALVGELIAPRDDGAGRWVEVASDDPGLCALLSTPGTHTLRFEVVAGAQENGLCLYGAATGREAPPRGSGALPGRVQLTLLQ